MKGEVGILNVGAGDTKLTFDNSNPMETARACRIVKDMLKRGYALFIEVGRNGDDQPVYRRALDFDEATAEYIIADYDPLAARSEPTPAPPADEDQPDVEEEETGRAAPPAAEAPAPAKRGRPAKKRVPAAKTNAVAVARTAGG